MSMYIKKQFFDKRGIDLEIELKGSVTDNTKKVEKYLLVKRKNGLSII